MASLIKGVFDVARVALIARSTSEFDVTAVTSAGSYTKTLSQIPSPHRIKIISSTVLCLCLNSGSDKLSNDVSFVYIGDKLYF